jgi:hypothetical protein
VSGASLDVLLSVVGTLLAGVGTVAGFLYARNRNRNDDLKAEVRAEEATKAQVDAVERVATAAYDETGSLRTEVRGLRSEVGDQGGRVSILESKMEVFWRNVAIDVSKILHSPHEGWESLDALLDKFRAQSIDDAEMAELEGHLREMVDGQWEPAEVTRADQVAASLLLRAIEQTRV